MDSKDSASSLVISESRGLYSQRLKYVIPSKPEVDNGRQREKYLLVEQHSPAKSLNCLYGLRLALRQVFLPHGYPNSVSSDYASYQIYDTIQAFCSSLTGALATEAVLKGVGVGDETASPLAATVTWLLKSASGMIGQIVFAYSKGRSLDGDCKRWRFFADVVNDLATFIDLITPAIYPSIRVGVFCVSSVARSLVGVAGGATRSAITQHQARNNNSADVSAKDGSQETLVNLIALVASLILLPLVSGNQMLIWSFYLFFTFFHLLANYKAIKSLQFESLNRARLLECLHHFHKFGKVPSIKHVNAVESVFVGTGITDETVTLTGYKINLGSSLKENLKLFSVERLNTLISESENKHFLILPSKKDKVIHIILEENITPWELVEAFVRAALIPSEDVSAMDKTITSQFLKLQSGLLQQGYSRDIVLLESSDWRASWKNIHFLPRKKFN